jgi:hypothetical protein
MLACSYICIERYCVQYSRLRYLKNVALPC